MNFYQVQNTRHQLIPMLQASNPIRKWLVTPHLSFHYCTVVISCLAGQFYNMQGREMDKILDVFSPLTYTAPANNMKDSQQGVSWLVPAWLLDALQLKGMLFSTVLSSSYSGQPRVMQCLCCFGYLWSFLTSRFLHNRTLKSHKTCINKMHELVHLKFVVDIPWTQTWSRSKTNIE